MNTLIIIPTYNEQDNIKELIRLIRRQSLSPQPHILIVDGASPDQTSGLVKEIQKTDDRLFLIDQKGKIGLGRTYLQGMDWALNRDYDYIFTMDGDLSHHPDYLNHFLNKLKSNDFVVGSRYVDNGGIEKWPLARRLLSRYANLFAHCLLNLPLQDLTSGFNGIRSDLLQDILRESKLKTDGYAFLIELKFLAYHRGASMAETGIVFHDRIAGKSKISTNVIWEAILFVLGHMFRKPFSPEKPISSQQEPAKH